MRLTRACSRRAARDLASGALLVRHHSWSAPFAQMALQIIQLDQVTFNDMYLVLLYI